MPYAQKNITSHCNRNVIYAPVNEWVDIIRINGDVLICEYKCNRFSCLAEFVGDGMVVLDEPIKEIKPQLELF